MAIAKRLEPFGQTIFTTITRLAIEHEAVNLGQGHPNFDGPSFVKDAAADAMARGENQYPRSFGIDPLVEAIAVRFTTDTGVPVDPYTQVTVTSGCTEALAASFLGLIEPGDEVVLIEPTYDAYRPDAALAGAVPRYVTLRAPDSVRDTAAFLDVVAGAAPADRYRLAPARRPFREAVASDPGVLRIAVMDSDFEGGPLHPDCVAAVSATAELVEQLGHTVELVTPDFDADSVGDAFLVVWAALAETIFQLVLAEAGKRRAGRALRRALGDWSTMRAIARLDQRKSGLEAFEPFTWELANRSRKRTPAQLALAEVELQQVANDLAAFMDGYDALLTPTMGLPPLLTGELDQRSDLEDFEALVRRYVPFTPSANYSGRPAMSVPLYWNDHGLPIGSHFMGNIGDEATMLSLAAQLERARPWFDHRPSLVG